ncbi:MAG: hypothetical protein IT176_08195 [Acidobacteria bacterium]|nr:hypothetical protein [Acidobacteriota bacterium]
MLTVTAALLVSGLAAQSPPVPLPPIEPSIIERVVSRDDPPPTQYRALRRLEAESDKLGGSAWLEAWTEADPEDGFRYQIVGEGGSGFVRGKVLKPWLENEKKMWANGDPERAALTHANYTFTDRGLAPDGLAWIDIKPRRKDLLLVEGAIFVNPEDGDLVRIEGRLSKTPSFWTRRVEVVRRYERIAGVRVPVAIESIANVLIAGRSTFKMTYHYETINHEVVGSPVPAENENGER